jgi:hypothetical protein
VNLRLLFCIGMGVFVTYLGIFMLIRQFRTEPIPVSPPRPNFSARSATTVDPVTGEKTVYREITVSTKFAPGETPASLTTPAPAAP